MEILSPAFCHRICPSYFDTCHKPAIPAFEGHASQASEPPRTTSILPAYALPTSDRPMLVVPFPRVLFKFRRLGVRMWSRPQGKAARVGHPGSACPSMRVFDVVLSQSWSGVMRMSGPGAAPLAADKGNSARASNIDPVRVITMHLQQILSGPYQFFLPQGWGWVRSPMQRRQLVRESGDPTLLGRLSLFPIFGVFLLSHLI
jgi:hypothetical protein